MLLNISLGKWLYRKRATGMMVGNNYHVSIATNSWGRRLWGND